MTPHSAVSASEIQAIFNRIAPVYDQLNDRLSLGLHRVWKQMAIKWAQPGPAQVWLDLCCGSGDLTFLLAEAVGESGHVYGVDFSEAQLAIAARRTQANGTKTLITWQQGDALDLPFADQSFDGVTMGYGLRNVVDIPYGLQELRRVLKRGHKAVILDFHRPQSDWLRAFQDWYLSNQVVGAARELGLKAEYDYILPSLQRFPTGSQQVNLARQAGFQEATHYRIFGGMMGVLVMQA